MLVNIDKNDTSSKVTKNNLVIAIIFANSWLPILTVVMIFVIWESVILIFGVPEYIAPTPSAVLETLVEERTLLFHNFLPTFFESVAGFVVGNLFAVVLAIAFVHNKMFEKAFSQLLFL